MKSTIDTIKALIAKGKTEEAISKTESIILYIANKEIEKLFYTISSNFSTFKSAELSGMLSFDEIQRGRSNITNGLFGLLNMIIDTKNLSIREKESLIEIEPIKRTEEISIYLKDLISAKNSGVIRQKAFFSTFSIPNRAVDENVWMERNIGYNRNKVYYEHQRMERYWLEEHLKLNYCKLIIQPSHILKDRGSKATLLRLKSFLSILKNYWDNIDVICLEKIEGTKFLSVGNWFVVTSNQPTNYGYKNSMFSWDKNEVETYIKQFDKEFDALLVQKDMDIYDAREETLEYIENRIKELK